MRWDDCFPGLFGQWPYWGSLTAKPTHSHAIFTLWVYIPTHLPLSQSFCSHWTNLPKKLLEVTSQIVWHIQGMLCHFLLKTILFQQAVAQGYLLLQVGSPYYLKRKALEWSQRSTNEFHHSCIPLHHQQCTGAWHGNCARAVFCMFVAILVYWYVQLPK